MILKFMLDRERKRERETDRQTDRHRDRQTYGMVRWTGGQTD